MSRTLKITLNEADYTVLKDASGVAHGGDMAGYVRTAALEKARSPTTITISGGGLTREGVERLMATLNGVHDREQA
jgi:hypothetical protein